MDSSLSAWLKAQSSNVNDWEVQLEEEARRCLRMQTILYFEHTQTESSLEIIINAPGIHKHPETSIEWEIRNTSLKINLKDFDELHRIFRINRLQHRVDVEKSTFSIHTDEMRFLLHKEKPGIWSTVIYLPEEVRTKFEKEYDDLVKSLVPSVAKISDSIEKQLRCRADIMVDNYFEPWTCRTSIYSLHIPSSIRGVKEKIKFVMEKLKNTFNPQHFQFVVECTLYQINEEFEEANPDCEKKKKIDEKSKSNESPDRGDTEEKRKAERLKEEGNRHFRAQRFSEAIKAYTEAINLASDCASYYYNRGLAFMWGQDHKSAYLDNCRCLTLNPFHCKAYIVMAKHKITQGDFEYAKIYLSVLKNINLHFSELKEISDTILKKEENQELFVQSMIKDEFQKTFSLLGSVLEAPNCWINPIREGVEEVCDRNKIDKAKKFVTELVKYLAENPLFKNYVQWDSDIFYLQGIISYYEGNELAVDFNFRKAFELLRDMDTESKYDLIKKSFALYNLGNQALSDGQLLKAVTFFSKCIELMPGSIVNARYLYKLAEVRQRQGRIKEAISTLNSAIDKRNDFAEAFALRGELHLAQGKYEQAISDFSLACEFSPCGKYRQQVQNAKMKMPSPKALEKQERNVTEKTAIDVAETLKEKGNSFYKRKMFHNAIECYTEAISVNPKCPSYFTNRSACYMALNRFSDGLKDAREAVKTDATFIKGFIRSGKCHLALGNVKDAMEAFEKARALMSSHQDVLDGHVKSTKLKEYIEKAEKEFEKKNFKEALNLFNAASNIACECGLLFLKRSECLIHLQRIKEVALLIESVPESLLENSYVLCMMALYSFHQCRKADAIEHLERAVQMDASNKKALELLEHVKFVFEKMSNGVAAWITGNSQKALQFFEKGLELETINATLQAKFHLQIGIMWMTQNKTTDAIKSFSNALKLNPDCCDSLECRGKCFLKVKEPKNAVKDFSKLYQLQPCETFHRMLINAQRVAYGTEKDYYGILGVSRDATMEAIRRSYKKLALQFHPDRLTSEVDKLLGEKQFKKISEAYGILSNPLKRDRYDSDLDGIQDSYSDTFNPYTFSDLF